VPRPHQGVCRAAPPPESGESSSQRSTEYINRSALNGDLCTLI
jgi:hypothetical protein